MLWRMNVVVFLVIGLVCCGCGKKDEEEVLEF